MKSHSGMRGHMNTSFWYFLHTTYGLKVRFAKRQAAREERRRCIRLKRWQGWHRCHEYNAGLINLRWEIFHADGKVVE